MQVCRRSTIRTLSIAAFFLASGLLLFCGCSRREYAQRADAEAYRLIAEKSNDARWDLSNFSIEQDPTSRYYDVYDTVEPPMPPDDPFSHELMHCIDGKEHWAHWHDFGDRPDLENPVWREQLATYVPFDEQGRIELGLEQAMLLALVNAPDYQSELETLYLSGLDVSTERFRFAVQFFGTLASRYENIGPDNGNVIRTPDATAGASASSSIWALDSGLTLQRRFATAGELLVGFANSTVWELVGPNRGISTSLLNFSLVQPLLRRGGRQFALEQLTIAERALLANLRAMERYRQGFFTEIAIGNNGTRGPQRRGGFFGGTGLTGFTGQGTGGFGGVGDATGFGGGFGGGDTGTGGGSGTTGFAGGGAGTLGGFLGLLQQSQQIRNSEQSLSAQLRTLDLLEANLEAGLIDIAQVDQFRQSIETERATLLQARNNFQDAVERFLTGTLGLPPDVPIQLQDTFIDSFRLVDGTTSGLQETSERLIQDLGLLNQDPSAEKLARILSELQSMTPRLESVFSTVKRDMEQVLSHAGEHAQNITDSERRLQERAFARMEQSVVVLGKEKDSTIDAVEKLATQVETIEPRKLANELIVILTGVKDIVGEMSLIQARSRLDLIAVEPVVLSPELAIEIARNNRLDWMNNRAALVDSWRLIEFNANALESDLTIRFEGDLQTLGGDNPLKFRDDTGTLRASVQFDPPFTRLTERNSFRQQLIEYQQSRRRLIQYEDGVYRTLRQLLRQLAELQTNLEIQRRAVAIAIRRVDQTREILNQPTPPPQPGAPPAQFGPTAALNLLTALSDMRNTQNNFLSVWLNYYGTRMVLMRELGLMYLDDRGMWVDQPLDVVSASVETVEPVDLPPPAPKKWLKLAEPPTETTGPGFPSADGAEAEPQPAK